MLHFISISCFKRTFKKTPQKQKNATPTLNSSQSLYNLGTIKYNKKKSKGKAPENWKCWWKQKHQMGKRKRNHCKKLLHLRTNGGHTCEDLNSVFQLCNKSTVPHLWQYLSQQPTRFSTAVWVQHNFCITRSVIHTSTTRMLTVIAKRKSTSLL